VSVEDSADRSAYERLRAAHLHEVRAALEDHVARLEWSRERIERYRCERLRGLLAHARERSPFHAARAPLAYFAMFGIGVAARDLNRPG
jgi:hypothetical protein